MRILRYHLTLAHETRHLHMYMWVVRPLPPPKLRAGFGIGCEEVNFTPPPS